MGILYENHRTYLTVTLCVFGLKECD